MAAFFKTKTAEGRTRNRKSSVRAPINTYYRSEKQPGAASPFAKKPAARNSRKFLFGFLDIILLVVVLGAVGYGLMVSQTPKVIASDTQFHSTAEYQAAAAAQLGQLKNRNKITLDENAVILSLQKRFPEISDARIELPFFSEQPVIRLAIAKPSIELSSQGTDYIVASNGVAVAKKADLPQIKGLTTVIDQSGFNIRQGSQVLSTSAIYFINSLIAECQAAKVAITSLTLPALPQELDLRAKDQPYYVKFYLGGDVLEQAGQFLAARKHFSDAGQQPGQYLDVRVSGKIFYK